MVIPQETPELLFVTGIGTDVGKSYAAGWLAREMRASGLNAVTQKMVQTGNIGSSEDIERHRAIMGTGMLPEDAEGLTAPVIFSYPCSPHLAAAIDGRNLDLEVIDKATHALLQRYSHVVMEGAGGLMVPLHEGYLTADYLRDRKIPTVVVVNGQLGSINHALLTLTVIKQYGIPLHSLIWNPHFDTDKTIFTDTRRYLRNWLKENFPEALWLDMPENL